MTASGAGRPISTSSRGRVIPLTVCRMGCCETATAPRCSGRLAETSSPISPADTGTARPEREHGVVAEGAGQLLVPAGPEGLGAVLNDPDALRENEAQP